MKFALSRRAVLRGAGGIAIGLPWMEAMGWGRRTARAATAPPKRLLINFTSNGYVPGPWYPSRGGETDFVLGSTLSVLERHRKDIVILDGINQSAANREPGDSHATGMGTLLTNIPLLRGNTRPGGVGHESFGLGGGKSVDQQIVTATAPNTKFASLELGINAGSSLAGTAYHYIGYKAVGVPLPPDNSPTSVFNRLFTNFSSGAAVDPSAIMKLRQKRQSILDAVTRSYTALHDKLGADDRQKLEAHLSSIRDLEKRLAVMNSAPASSGSRCVKPTGTMPAAKAGMPVVGKAQMDLLVTALACDLTRVATLQWSSSSCNDYYPWLNITESHHNLAHAMALAPLARIDAWYAARFADLLDALKSVPEGDGTMLDNTLVLWCNELSVGGEHSHNRIPLILAGRAGRRLRTGRFLKFGGQPHGKLLVSILNAFDVPAKTFGLPEFSNGPLPGLVS